MVITLDKRKRPLGTCTEKRAKKLLEQGRACIYRRYPFAIIIKDMDARKLPEDQQAPVCRVKIDPGAQHTGISIIRVADDAVLLKVQIDHRGSAIVKKLETRHNARRNRRQRETRYRRCKYPNRFQKKGSKYKAAQPSKEGWLPPSVKSVGDNILHWVDKLSKLFNLKYGSFEAVRFDTQLMDNPDIEGVEYQQGELFGLEVKEYLLNKFGYVCQYCGGVSGSFILEWEHIHPKSKGGSDSVKNATLACDVCNKAKGNKLLPEWLAEQEAIVKNTKVKDKSNPPKKVVLAKARIEGIKRVMDGKSIKKSDRYCAWSNSTRRYVEKGLFSRLDDVECSSGGRTKYNRKKLGLPKTHCNDALCVGTVPEKGYKDLTNGYVLFAKAEGRGSRLIGKINECGVITVKFWDRQKRVFGFQNGDIVQADIPKGKYKGRWLGKCTIRRTGKLDISYKNLGDNGTLETAHIPVNYKNCKVIQRCDGYSYLYRKEENMPIV